MNLDAVFFNPLGDVFVGVVVGYYLVERVVKDRAFLLEVVRQVDAPVLQSRVDRLRDPLLPSAVFLGKRCTAGRERLRSNLRRRALLLNQLGRFLGQLAKPLASDRLPRDLQFFALRHSDQINSTSFAAKPFGVCSLRNLTRCPSASSLCPFIWIALK